MNMDDTRRLTFTIAAAGCTVSTSPQSSPSATTAQTSTPTPTPTAAPEADPADPGTWIISDAGIGPVTIGGDFAATLGSLPDTWTNDEACSWTAWWNAPDSSYGVYFVRGTESDTEPLSEISAYSAAEDLAGVDGPRTAEGLGVGSTTDEVLAAYPDAEQGTAEIGTGTWLRLAGDADGHVFFQFREGETNASSVVVTTRDQPSYEVCG